MDAAWAWVHGQSKSAPTPYDSRIVGCIPVYTTDLWPHLGNPLHLFLALFLLSCQQTMPSAKQNLSSICMQSTWER